jgi:hypothetical protein
MSINRAEIIQQTKLAYDFIDKLFLECAYLIKEIESILSENENKFTIGKPGGYGIAVNRSSGLESKHVKLWLMKKFSVFFASEANVKHTAGVTETLINENLKVLYLRLVLANSNEEPSIYSGIFYNIWGKASGKEIKKFEHVMGQIQNKDDKIFKHDEKIDYEDPNLKLKGRFLKNSLFEINDSQEIINRIITPTLKLYNRLNN